MVKKDYEIQHGNITSNSEETSAISKISYEIENANNNGLTDRRINDQFQDLKKHDSFPKNLTYLKSFTDPNTGTTTTAFKNEDTGKVTLGMTGTNVHLEAMGNVLEHPFNHSDQDEKDAEETLKDFRADVNIGLGTVTDKDPHFKDTQDFIKDIKKEYEIDTITGHSLGGRDAVILGVSNDIKNIVVYNPAPLSIRDFRIFAVENMPASAIGDIEIEKMLKNYNGHIVRFVSDKDELDGFVSQFMYDTAGEKIVLNNGEGHDMEAFLRKYAQAKILAELRKVKGYEDANNKAFKSLKENTKSKLGRVEELRANWLQANGGALSSSQQKLLESVSALIITEGLSQLVKEESSQLEKMYDNMKDKFQENWKNSQEAGNKIGTKLSHDEVLTALRNGDAYESKFETDPETKIKQKLKELNDINSDCHNYVSKIKDSVNAIVGNDQLLASQIAGVI
ncbi:hypothetical protein [Staphylococcus aureus]|uniref:hypothetical protein n=1 Tax=Staphylococcus aureus TaxID=1280 RepID=UPI003F5C3AFC